MTAIIVEANEGSTRAVDDIVAVGGGHVYRQDAAQIYAVGASADD
jgi:hypothetical protein